MLDLQILFVATKILKSLTKNILTSKEIQEFYSSTLSITTEIRKTLASCKKRKNMSNFLKNMVTLALSYSINSKIIKKILKIISVNLIMSKKLIKKNLLYQNKKENRPNFEKSGMKFNTNMFLTFARKVIYLREFAKQNLQNQ